MFNLIVIQPIFNLLLFIYSIIPGQDFGIALIIFTIMVRFALWPLVKKQLHQTKAMQKMQPELAKIKKQAKGNRQVEGMMMMELYKKYDINPFRSIVVLIIQLPIFIALYQVIQIFTLHRDRVEELTYSVLKGIEPVKALIADPASFNEKMLGFIDLSQSAISANSVNIILFLLVIAATVIQYIMTKQTTPKQQSKKKIRDILNEAAEGKQADQSEMNAAMMGSMTKFLPAMMFFVMIGLPGAVVLYYTVSNLIAVFQQKHVLKEDAEEMIELAEKEVPSQNKKATAKARAKQAREANIVRITAKDDRPKKGKS